MPDNYNEWFKTAEDDLNVAQILFQNKKYPHAIFNLQQACEKISKGLLMRIGFLPAYEEPREIKEVRKVVGVPPSTPREYGHAWHRKMLDVLETFICSFDNIAKSMEGIRLSEQNVMQNISQFRKSVPDFKERIMRARKVKTNPNPSLQEIDGVIKYCNELLDSSLKAEAEARASVQKIKLPDKKVILRKIEKRLKIKVDKETLKKIDRIYGKNPVEYVTNLVIFSETLIILAILNVYLVPHEYISRYPDAKMDFAYDENLSIVVRFNELTSLLRRCLKFASVPE